MLCRTFVPLGLRQHFVFFFVEILIFSDIYTSFTKSVKCKCFVGLLCRWDCANISFYRRLAPRHLTGENMEQLNPWKQNKTLQHNTGYLKKKKAKKDDNCSSMGQHSFLFWKNIISAKDKMRGVIEFILNIKISHSKQTLVLMPIMLD